MANSATGGTPASAEAANGTTSWPDSGDVTAPIVGADGALPKRGEGARKSPRDGVRGMPVAGSTGSTESGAAVTPKLPAERPRLREAWSLRPLPPLPPSIAGSGAQPTATFVTTKSLSLGSRLTALPPALPHVY